MQMLITGMQTLKRKVLFSHSTNIYCAVKPLAAGDIAVKRKNKYCFCSQGVLVLCGEEKQQINK